MDSAMFWLQLLTLLLAIMILLAGLWTLHKVRQLHLASYKIATDANEARRESKQIFAQLQALHLLEATLQLPYPLPQMRGWAGSPDFLLTVADNVLTHHPITVVECSSGISTLVLAGCLKMNGAGHVYSLEHEEKYVQKTQDMLKKYDLEEWATVLHSPLNRSEHDAMWYDDSVLPGGLKPIEMLVVDGPPGETAPLARLPALPRLLPRMATDVVVVLDDAARPAESEIVKRWAAMAPSFELTYLDHEKGCAVLKRRADRDA